jgi:hypothetical protein
MQLERVQFMAEITGQLKIRMDRGEHAEQAHPDRLADDQFGLAENIFS